MAAFTAALDAGRNTADKIKTLSDDIHVLLNWGRLWGWGTHEF